MSQEVILRCDGMRPGESCAAVFGNGAVRSGEARAGASAAGWTRRRGGTEDLCPHCTARWAELREVRRRARLQRLGVDAELADDIRWRTGTSS